MKTEKPCKGVGKTAEFGCGKLTPVRLRKYGLGLNCGCFLNWVKSTESGQEYAIKQIPIARRINAKESKERLSSMKVDAYGKENRKLLANECQRLARMIDKKFNYSNCIDCGIAFGNQIDGGHFHSKGANASIQWNLHNIHSQASHCNQNGIGGGKQLGYYEGLIERYGKDYAERVRFELVRIYPTTKMSNKEVYDKLGIARKLVRDFDTFILSDSIQAREMFNKLIGIYQL